MHLSKRNDLVVQRIFSEILRGTKGAEGRLPSAEAIAKEYAISIASVREALKFMESIGLVTLSHGRGIFVESREDIVDELLGARKVIECSNAREAATNRGEEDIKRFCDILDRMDRAFDEHYIDDYSSLDLELHVFISELSKNRILKKILENIRLVMYYQQVAVNRIPPLLEQSHSDHHLLVQAIIDRKAERAFEIMAAHLDQVSQSWKQALQRGITLNLL